MGGTSQQTQQQNSNQNMSATGQRTIDAYAPANPAINNTLSALGNINASSSPGLSALSALGQQGNQFAGQIGGVANNLLSGGGANSFAPIASGAYADYQRQLSPYANGDNVDPYKTPGFSDAMNTIGSDISQQVNSQFAAAGRDLSGYNQQALARGLSQGQGQLYQNQYNQNVQNQLGAAGNLFGAGNTTAGTLSGLNQLSLANQQAGIGAAGAANEAEQYGPLLQIQAQTGIPLQQLAAIMGIALPAGATLGTQNQTQQGTQSGQQTGTATKEASGLEQFQQFASGLGSLFSGGGNAYKSYKG